MLAGRGDSSVYLLLFAGLAFGLGYGVVMLLGRLGAKDRKKGEQEVAAILALSEERARALALEVITRGEGFASKPATAVPPLDGLPKSVRELFGQFEEVVAGEFWLGHAALAEPPRVVGTHKIGEDMEFEELLVKPNDEGVFSSYGDAPDTEPLERYPSVWHRIALASGRKVEHGAG